MVLVDAVVVAYNSRETLRASVEDLANENWIQIIVVDNDSHDQGIATISDLPVTPLALDRNYGFAYACNRGAEAGFAPFILFSTPTRESNRMRFSVCSRCWRRTTRLQPSPRGS